MVTNETIKIIEERSVEMDYGFRGTWAVIDHPKHGRLLLCQGYGGETSLQGGGVRWRHGLILKLQPGDTIGSLEALPWNDEMATLVAARHGYDPDRPLMEWNGHVVAAIAKAAGL